MLWSKSIDTEYQFLIFFSLYIYIYICIHTHTHTHTYIYIHIHTHTHIYIYLYTHTHTHTHIYIYIYIYIYMNANSQIYKSISFEINFLWGWLKIETFPGLQNNDIFSTILILYIHICTDMHTHTHIYMYIYIYIYILYITTALILTFQTHHTFLPIMLTKQNFLHNAVMLIICSLVKIITTHTNTNTCTQKHLFFIWSNPCPLQTSLHFATAISRR